MNHDDLLDKIFDVDVRKDDPTRVKLKQYIKETHEFIKNSKISDWQKVKLAEAIEAHRIDFLYLCLFCLVDVFTDPKEITKDNRHLEHLRKHAEEINLDELIRRF